MNDLKEKPILDIQCISKRFGGLVAINQVSLQIHPGEILGLIGPNGAGKTTLFNLITGFYRIDTGDIYFLGERISRLKPHQCCRLGIGRTFQIDKAFEKRDVLYNVTVGALPRLRKVYLAEKEALNILSFVGLDEKKFQLAGSLTIADRKRLEIAKALSTSPKLLLLDEVMAGLTPKEIEDAIGLIHRIRDAGTTIFMIEHVMQVIMSLSNRIAILHYGEKIGEGAPQEIAKDKRVIEAYLGEEYVFHEDHSKEEDIKGVNLN